MSAPKMIVWWKNGDHPKDKSKELPLEERTAEMVSFLTEGAVVGFSKAKGAKGDELCPTCSAPYGIHGIVEGHVVVHPGDEVSVNPVKGSYLVVHPDPMAQAQRALEGMAVPVEEEA